MAQIERIQVALWTASTSNAGTDGDVYLGLGGREFYLDTSKDDFERGRLTHLYLGDHGLAPPSTEPTLNDPRTLRPVATAHLGLFPAYLRYHPTGGDTWKLNLAYIVASARDGAGELRVTDVYSAGIPWESESSGIWLGPKSGLSLYLFRNQILDLDTPRGSVQPPPGAGIAAATAVGAASAPFALDLGVLLGRFAAAGKGSIKKKEQEVTKKK